MVFLIVYLVSFTSSIYSQALRLQLGINKSKLIYRDAVKMRELEPYASSLYSLYLGVTTEFSLSRFASIESGLFINPKGERYRDDNNLEYFYIGWFSYYLDNNYAEGYRRISYLGLPVILYLKLGSDKINFRPFIGTELNIGLSSVTKYNYYLSGKSGNVNIHHKFGNKPDQLKRFDVTLNLGVALEIKRMQYKFEAQFGKNPISNSTKFEEKLYNLAFKLGVSYRLFSFNK